LSFRGARGYLRGGGLNGLEMEFGSETGGGIAS